MMPRKLSIRRNATSTAGDTEDTGGKSCTRQNYSSVSSVVVRLVMVVLALVSFRLSALAQTERPAVGPERPFQLAPRVERTLPNGLRVVVTRQTAIPKVSITLTVLSGYSSDPADLTGLASLTADLIQEGTKTRSSRQIRRDAFGMGGSLTAAASQDYTS